MSRDMLVIRSYCQDEIIYLEEFIIDNRQEESSSELTKAKTLIQAYKRVINHIDAVAVKHMKQEDQHDT